MRRSSSAMTSTTPSSTPPRPMPHCSATRNAYGSMASGAVVRTSSTAIWLPLRSSNAVSFCSSASTASADRVAVVSTTWPVSGGTACCAAAAAAPSTNSSSSALGRECRALTSTSSLAEADLRRTRNLGFVLDRERRLRVVAEDFRRQVARKAAYRDVVALHGFDVAVTRDCDTVFRALELRLQIAKVRIGFELGIAFDDDHEPRQGAREVALRRLELRERLWIVEDFRRRLHGADSGTCLRDTDQDVALLLREAAHGFHEIRNQVGTPLILVHHLGPRRLDLLVLCLEGVVAASRELRHKHDRHQ